MWMIVLGTLAWVIGGGTAKVLYGKEFSGEPLQARFPVFYDLCKSKLFFDEIYGFYVAKIQDPFARFIEVMELLFISGLLVRGSAGISALFALLAKTCYVGKIHAYSFWFILGTLGFLAYAVGLLGN